jgi:hypothetical protein
MKTMLHTIYIPMFAEAAQAVSVTRRPLPVDDGNRFTSVPTLAARCAR